MKSSKRWKNDIVYILRNDIINISELIYSLRSLDNFQHGRVIFAGGIPETLKPDRALEIKQQGATKWERATFTIKKVCEDKDISKSFYLFNDDFFILQKTATIPTIYNGTIADRIENYKKQNGGQISDYFRRLEQTAEELTRRGLSSYNYAVHVPMLIDKEKALEVFDVFDGLPMFRSLYGNYWNIGGKNRADVKISTIDELPSDNADFVSTSDESFKRGAIGRYIRTTFKTKSTYEL